MLTGCFVFFFSLLFLSISSQLMEKDNPLIILNLSVSSLNWLCQIKCSFSWKTSCLAHISLNGVHKFGDLAL